MAKLSNFLLPAMIAAALAGCATPYVKHGGTGGYLDRRIAANQFGVAFNGNGYTSAQRAYDLALLRAAELTLAHGYSFFLTYDSKSVVDRSTGTTSTTYVPTGYGSGVSIGNYQTISKPASSMGIQCFRNRPWTDSQTVYVARDVAEKLRANYKVKEPFQKGTIDIEARNRQVLKSMTGVCPGTGNPADDPIVVLERNEAPPGAGGIVRAFVPIADFYFDSDSQLNELAVLLAAQCRANTAFIWRDRQEIRDLARSAAEESGVKHSVIPQIYIELGVRKPSIGMNFEPRLSKDKIFEIRSFPKAGNARAAGLKIGDRIVGVDGHDTLKRGAFDYKGKATGEIVTLEVTRGGEVIEIGVPLFDGWAEFLSSEQGYVGSFTDAEAELEDQRRLQEQDSAPKTDQPTGKRRRRGRSRR